MAITRLNDLLKSSTGGDLENLVQTAQHMGDLTQALQRGIEPELATALVAASVRDNGELVVVASTSAWAARLRFESEQLQSIAQTHGHAVTACRVIVSKQV